MGWRIRVINKAALEIMGVTRPVYFQSRIQDSIVVTDDKLSAKEFKDRWELHTELCRLEWLVGKGHYAAEPILTIVPRTVQ